MSYAADGGGTIRFKTDTPNSVIQMVGEDFREILWETYTEKGRPLEMDVFPAFRYDEDELYAVLNNVFSYIDSADLSFIGEDGAMWKITANSGKLSELNGRCVYQMKDVFSEDELLYIRNAVLRMPDSDERNQIEKKMNPEYVLF